MGTSLRTQTVFWNWGPVCRYVTFWWRRAYALGMLACGGMTKLAGIDSCWGRNDKELQSWRCCEWIVWFLARRSKIISFSMPRIQRIWLHPCQNHKPNLTLMWISDHVSMQVLCRKIHCFICQGPHTTSQKVSSLSETWRKGKSTPKKNGRFKEDVENKTPSSQGAFGFCTSRSKFFW